MLEKRSAERGKHEAIEPRRFAEPHLHLGRMHVDIDHVGWHLERQKYDRLTSREQQPAVSLLHRMEDRAIAKRPSGHEEMLQASAGHVVLGAAHEAADRDLAVFRRDLDQSRAKGRAKEPANPVAPRRHGRQIVNAAAVVREGHRHPRMGQGRADEGLRCMRPLRLGRTQKRPTGRHVAEELMHLDGRAHAAAFRHDLPNSAAIHRQAGPRTVRSA